MRRRRRRLPATSSELCWRRRATTVGDTPAVVVASEDGIHSYENPGDEFDFREERISTDGSTLDPATGESADGRQLDRIPSQRLFAFAWRDDHGSDAFYDPSA